jgi:TRAP transporter TAXI family solute receptor
VRTSASRTLALGLITAALAVAGCGGAESGDGSSAGAQITIAANPAGTHVYTVAAGLAKLLQEQRGRRATIRPFQGSSVYLPMLQRGDIALGLNTNIDGYLSFRGLPPYDAPMRNLRTLGMIFPLNIMFMVRADSDLYRIEDLRGKRVAVTFRANAALEQLHRGILATGGLDLDDIAPLTVAGLPEAMTALQEGRADAVPTGLNTALSLQVDSALSDGVRYLTMGENESRLAEIMPGTRVVTIQPGPNVVGVPSPIRVSSVPDMLNTGVHMSGELAYEIVRTIHTNFESLQRDLPQLAGMTAADLAPSDNMHPYHEGAVRYYREAGLWTAAHEANQTALLRLAETP